MFKNDTKKKLIKKWKKKNVVRSYHENSMFAWRFNQEEKEEEEEQEQENK